MDIFLETDKYIQEEIENLNKPVKDIDWKSNQKPSNTEKSRTKQLPWWILPNI